MRRLIHSCCLLPLLARADFTPSEWRFRRPVIAAAAGQVTAVPIRPAVCIHAAARLDDLRVERNGEEVPYFLDRGPARITMATIAPARHEDPEERVTVLAADFGGHLPHDRVRVDASTAFFHRATDVDSSDDGRQWRTLARVVIYRLPGEESLGVLLPEQWDRYLRLRIFNRDDRPLEVTAIAAEALEIWLKFLPATPGQYWLYYGNPGARRPSYDLGQVVAGRSTAVQVAEAGAAQQNPAWRPPVPPWTERHPGVLYTALLAAIAVLGWFTLRFWWKTRGL